jgi:phage tail sheath protein FI
MPTYKTPGVYIEEAARLPHAVTGVATAAPAFTGFTEHAIDADGNDLTQVAARITSLQEYERYFGRAPAQDFAVDVTQRRSESSGKTTDTRIAIATVPPYIPSYLLYYSMQLFFANGGALCYETYMGHPLLVLPMQKPAGQPMTPPLSAVIEQTSDQNTTMEKATSRSIGRCLEAGELSETRTKTSGRTR